MGKGAAIVNVGSIGGKFGVAGRAIYPASKAALMQLTKNQAMDLAQRGIRVNSAGLDVVRPTRCDERREPRAR